MTTLSVKYHKGGTVTVVRECPRCHQPAAATVPSGEYDWVRLNGDLRRKPPLTMTREQKDILLTGMDATCTAQCYEILGMEAPS